jgi:hypothetical protein
MLTSHCRALRSVLDDIWYSWWMKWQWDRMLKFLQLFLIKRHSPCSTSIYHCLLLNQAIHYQILASSLTALGWLQSMTVFYASCTWTSWHTFVFKFPLELYMKLNVATLAVCWTSLQGTAANKNLFYKAVCGTDMKEESKSMGPL